MRDENEKWRLCIHCINAIKSRGEMIFVGNEVLEDEDDPSTFTCEWCEEDGVTVYGCL